MNEKATTKTQLNKADTWWRAACDLDAQFTMDIAYSPLVTPLHLDFCKLDVSVVARCKNSILQNI